VGAARANRFPAAGGRNQLSPDRHRGAVRTAVVFACPAVLFMLLLQVVNTRHGAPVGPDEALHQWVVGHRSADLAAAARLLASTGAGPAPYVAAMLAGWAACSRRGSSRLEASTALAAVATLLTGQGIRLGVMSALARPRPPAVDWAAVGTDYSFPSGHATTTALAAGLLAWSALRSDAPRRAVQVSLIACGCWALAVGATRVYLGVHWPTDVLGGWLLGAAWLALTLPLLSRLAGPGDRTL
jgi:membrane-associated phospholipid phosphatase